MTNATTIRIAINAEIDCLNYRGNNEAAAALQTYINSVSGFELTRLRDLLVSATEESLIVHNAD